MKDHRPPKTGDIVSAVLTPDMLILVPKLGAFVLFSGLYDPLPEKVRAFTAGTKLNWSVINWVCDDQRFALAKITGQVPTLGFTLAGDENAMIEVAMARKVSADIEELAHTLKAYGADFSSVFRLASGDHDSSDDFNPALFALLECATETAGFFELVATPQTGGRFLQGWSQSPLVGRCRVITEHGVYIAHAAPFERSDILAPAAGFCLYVKDWKTSFGFGGIFIEANERILKIDTVGDALGHLDEDTSELHLRDMLARIDLPSEETAWLRRLCRPRFGGKDTLSSCAGPIAAACDCILRAEEGGIFVSGWLLDPLHQVERALIKSTGNFYGLMDKNWHRLRRPDINDGFAADPRFSSLLSEDDSLHGFLCFLPGPHSEKDGEQYYLELVLADGGCLFMPIAPTLCRDIETGKAILSRVPRHDPAHLDVIKNLIVPFLADLPARKSHRQTPLRLLGTTRLSKPVAALMCVHDFRQLSAVFATLADTPDAEMLDLVIALDDTVPADRLATLDSQFEFYNMTGAVALLPSQTPKSRRLDALTQEVSAEEVFLWDPDALPKTAGWLPKLRQSHRNLQQPALSSPLVTYEDSSIHFAGSRVSGRSQDAVCVLAGIDRRQVTFHKPEPVTAGAAECALINRKLLQSLGGVGARLLGDAHCHNDLGWRLRQAGYSAWCAPEVEFWMLASTDVSEDGDETALLAELDSALIEHRAVRERSKAET